MSSCSIQSGLSISSAAEPQHPSMAFWQPNRSTSLVGEKLLASSPSGPSPRMIGNLDAECYCSICKRPPIPVAAGRNVSGRKVSGRKLQGRFSYLTSSYQQRASTYYWQEIGSHLITLDSCGWLVRRSRPPILAQRRARCNSWLGPIQLQPEWWRHAAQEIHSG